MYICTPKTGRTKIVFTIKTVHDTGIYKKFSK